jgi:hypothetical protein
MYNIFIEYNVADTLLRPQSKIIPPYLGINPTYIPIKYMP